MKHIYRFDGKGENGGTMSIFRPIDLILILSEAGRSTIATFPCLIQSSVILQSTVYLNIQYKYSLLK